MAVYFATNGIDAILEGFGQSYHDTDTYSWWKQKLAAFLMMMALSLMIVVSMSFLAFGKVTIYFLAEQQLITDRATIIFLRLLQWLIIILITLTGISLLYYFGQPKDRQRNRYRFFSPGAILGTTLFVVGGLLIKLYFENFARYNLLYGSIGSIIILLVWLYYNAIILLIGFELNASIRQSKAQKSTYRIVE
jgi:membrane protein